MKLAGPGARHLTYCTNIHPGESWDEVRENLERYVLPVRERVAAGEPFGIGLRLSALAAQALGEEPALAELRAFLDDHGLYVFTINGFPYGPFHGRPVKEQVYRPDWLEPERVAYTDRLADILAALLPPDVEGTVSTVPGAFAQRVAGEVDEARMAAALVTHVAHLVRLRERTGRHVTLALEPEPCCHLETVAQAVEFFECWLFAEPAVRALARQLGVAEETAETALQSHLGLCLDTCHMAVEYEAPERAVAALEGAGVRIAKVQVSAGLRVELDGGEALDELEAFADDVYLHQVVERDAAGGLRRYLDLPEALAARRADGGDAREWRVHFHVPLFQERLGRFESTQRYVEEALAVLAERCAHFEVETYTWDVLPEEHRSDGVVAAVAREVEWAAARLGGAAG